MKEVPNFISVKKAFEIIKSKAKTFGTELVDIGIANRKILAETFKADRDFPPFDRVSMDGIAINFSAFKKGQNEFKIEATCSAGSPQRTLTKASNCIEIMTGASLPIGCDTVIRYEDLTIAKGVALINIADVNQGQNIHSKGQDMLEGDLLAAPGAQINPAIIGIAASIGKLEVEVYKNPKTIIISTGDELVDIHTTPLPHQIRKSNVYVVNAILNEVGISSDMVHINDDYDTLSQSIGDFLRRYDLIILSGGVSMGKYDYIPKVMTALGVETHFHKITQRPGKPMWFGSHIDGATIFALPGNPISTTMTAYVYLKYWLHQSIGIHYPTLTATLASDVNFKPDLTYFMEVTLQQTSAGQYLATPKRGNGSGDLANLVGINGFMELPKGETVYKKGESYIVYLV